MKDKNLTKMEKCSRFNKCSANLCPLDLEAREKDHLLGEDICPFRIKKKSKSQKGSRTQMSPHILELVPESNLKILNNANQKLWQDFHKGRKS